MPSVETAELHRNLSGRPRPPVPPAAPPRRLTVSPRASPSPRSALWLGAVALSLALVGADVPRTRAPAAALAATAVRVEPIEARGRDEIEDRFADALAGDFARFAKRSEAHTSELQSLMRISYAVFCWTTQ